MGPKIQLASRTKKVPSFFDMPRRRPPERSLFPSSTLFSLLILIALLGILGCSFVPERLTPSRANGPSIIREDTPFADYITRSKQRIQAARIDPASADRDPAARNATVRANTPFEYRPSSNECKDRHGPFEYRHGILLIHGLTASPYMMQDLGRFFRARCFLVRSILLPGHGTRPGDLLDIHYQDWVKAVDYGARSFEGQVEGLFLAGYSIGGALAFHHALSRRHTKNGAATHRTAGYPSLKGLFLFSPALKPKSGLAFLAGTVSLFKDWRSTTSDRDYAAYESFPYNAAAQSHRLIREINHLTRTRRTFPVPVFVALSEDDETVDSRHTIDVFRRYMNVDQNHMQLYTTEPQTYASDLRIEALQSRIDDEKILSFSHTSITVPRDHPHYGITGDYRRCLHYPEQSAEWLACTGDPDIHQGETSKTILERHTIRQLTYNAYFSQMLSAMERFLERI